MDQDLTCAIGVTPVHSGVVAPDSIWEIVFLMVILKIPIVYLCVVIYYAVRAEPKPDEGAAVTARIGPDDDGRGGLRRRVRPRRLHPHGGPSRTYPRVPRAASATARRREHR